MKPTRVNFFQKEIVGGYLRVFVTLLEFCRNYKKNYMLTVDWHFYLENLENKARVFYKLKEFVNNT